jgi:hypothetical protein
MSLVHCIYASAAAPGLTAADLRDLVETSRHNNERLGISGILLYVEGSFFQVLEGNGSVVAPLYAAIQRDLRHTNITQIICESIPCRSFAGWSMGYLSISRDELSNIVGIRSFSTQHDLAGLAEGRAKKLLTAFGQGRWRQRVQHVQLSSPASLQEAVCRS